MTKKEKKKVIEAFIKVTKMEHDDFFKGKKCDDLHDFMNEILDNGDTITLKDKGVQLRVF